MIESIELFESGGALYCVTHNDDDRMTIDCHAIEACDPEWDRTELDGQAAEYPADPRGVRLTKTRGNK